MGLGVFISTEKGCGIMSEIYPDQVLMGPLQKFWAESFLDCKPVIMEDNIRLYKAQICNKVREELDMECLAYLLGSPDFSPFEIV